MASITSPEWRVLCEKYQRSVTLSEIESKKDPENDPFRSKYNARELLKQIRSSLGQYTGENETEQGENGQQQTEKELQVEQQIAAGGDSPAGLSAARLGVIEYQLGVNHTETEELSAGEEHLMNCIRLMDKYEVTQENISLFIQSRNQIGVLWAGRGEIETAQGFLESAEALYNRYMKERQLEFNNFAPLEWAVNAATLSQYYITKSCYMEGRHCLAAASVVVGLAGEVPSVAAAKESEAESEKREKLCQRKAEIARCWIKYCLNLINDAKKMLEDNIGELDADRQAEMKVRRRQEEEEKEKGRKTVVLFGSSDTSDSILSMEEKVSCAYPLDFNEARAIFLVGQNYVNEAKEYFQIDGHATDHIEVVQDHSALFKALAFFEDDYERCCKMHKRRIDMLEPICKDLNPQYYLLISRQLQFEVAETYYEMMDLKIAVADKQEELEAHTIRKINHLTTSSIKYYELFLDSLKTPDKKFPDKLEEDVLRPAIVAKFRIARLYSRIITADSNKQIENISQSLEYYRFVVDYCTRNQDAKKAVETELELSEEMASLLPLRLERLRAKLTSVN
ncbi:UNVERIFIED_CONTAM: hypothetical protein FKN15_033447 [Acipenser sinensis]